ncbi:MAG: phage tail tip lysozyme [Paracoccaceae bacterium]
MAQTFNIPFGTQLAFLYDELLGKEKKTLDAFKSGNFSTPTEYAVAFENLYERADGSKIERRTRFADEVFAELNKDNPDLSENALEASKFLGSKGFDNAQKAGIIGNLMAESYKTLLPDAFNSKGGGQGAYGIAQWRGSRLEDLVNFNKNYPNTEPPLNANKNLGPIVRGTTSEETSGENRMASLMDMLMGRRPEEENRSEMTGMNRFFNQRNQATGLTPFQSLGAGMDSLILRGYGQGEAIREQGLRQAAQDKTNLTADFFRGQPNGELYAEMLEMGVPIGQVYTAYQKAQAGDYVVVGNTLIDRSKNPPTVIFEAKTGGQSQGTIKLPDGTEISLGKQSEAQAKGMDFGARMELANMTINQVEDIGADLGQTFFSKIPVFGNAMVSTEFQQYNQAREQFINSVLRRESGAAIAASEFEGANKQYFPQPFDGPEVIAQKRAARQIAIDMILASSGPNASELAKQKANELAKSINPLFGTEEYKKERELLKSGGNKSKTAGGNNIVDPSTF